MEMASGDFDSFIRMLRRKFSRYVDEALIDSLEDSIIMDDHEKASSLATTIFQKIPQHLLTDRVVQGIESIQNTSQGRERLLGKTLVEKNTSTKRTSPKTHVSQTKFTDTDVATFGYYLHILARGIQEKDRRDIQSVLKGCDQQKPLVQDVYKIACGVEDLVIQIKSREKATLLCLAWYEDTLKRMLDKDDVHTDGIPGVYNEAMFDKRENAIIESTHRLLSKLKKRLREFRDRESELQYEYTQYKHGANWETKHKKRENSEREDFQPKIEALEKRNAQLKDKLSTLRKQTEEKVAQLSKANNDGDDDEKKQTKLREKLDKTLARVQQLENTTIKERNKQNGEKSNLPNDEGVRNVIGESIELTINSLPCEDGERSNTVQEELRQLKEKTNDLSKDLHRKREQNKRLLQRDSELTKEIADLRKRFQEAEITNGQTDQSANLGSPAREAVLVKDRDIDVRAEYQESSRRINQHSEDSRSFHERGSQRKLHMETKDKRRHTNADTSVMPKPVISLPFTEPMPLAQTEDNRNTCTTKGHYSENDIDQFFAEESRFTKRSRASKERRNMETKVDALVEPHVVESRNLQYSRPQGKGEDTNNFDHDGAGLSDKVHTRKSLKDRVRPCVLESGSVKHWKGARTDKISEDIRTKPKELNDQVKPDHNSGGLTSPTTVELDQLNRNSLETYATTSLESPVIETQSPLYRSLEATTDMIENNSGHSNARHGRKSLKDRVKPCILESGSVNQWKKVKSEHKPEETRSPPRGPNNDVIQPEYSDTGLTATITEKRDHKVSSQSNGDNQPESIVLEKEDGKRNLKERMKPCLLGSTSVNNWKERVTRPQTEQNSGIGLVNGGSSERNTSQLQEEILRLNKRNEQLERQMEQQQRNSESKLDNQRRDVRSVRSDLEQDKDDIQRRYQNKIDQLQRDIRNFKSHIGEDKDDLLKRLRQTETEKSELENINNQLEREKKDLEEKLQMAKDENERHIETVQHLEKEKGSVLTGKTPDKLESTAVEQWKETAKKSKLEKAASGNSFLDANEKTLQELEEENGQLREEIKQLKARLGENHDDNCESGITVDNGDRIRLKDGVKKYMVGTASINQWKESMADSQTENVSNTTGVHVTGGSLEEQVKQLLAENTNLSKRLQEAENKLGLSDHSDKGLKPLDMKNGHLQDSYQDELEHQQKELRSVKSDLEQDKDDIQRRYQNKIDQQQRDIRNVKSDLEEDKDDLQRRLKQYESEKSDKDRTIKQLENEKRDLEEKLQQAIDEKETQLGEDRNLEMEKSGVQTRNKPEHLESAAIQQWKETATKSKTEKSKPGNSFLDSNENPNEDLNEEIRQLRGEITRLKNRLQDYGEDNNLDQEGKKRSLKDRIKPFVLESASVNKWKKTLSHPQIEKNIEKKIDARGKTGKEPTEEIKQLIEENIRLNKSLQDAECRIRDLENANPGLKATAMGQNESEQNSYQNKLDEQERELRNVRSDLEGDNDDIQRRYKNKIDQMQREIRNVRRDLEEEKDDLQRRLRETESEKNEIEKTLNQLKQKNQDMEEKLQLVEDENNRHIETVQQLEKGQASAQTRIKPEHLELTAASHWVETAKKSKTEKSNPENRKTADNVASTDNDRFVNREHSEIQTSKPEIRPTDKLVRLEELEVHVIYLESEKKSADLRNVQMKRQLEQQQHELERIQTELLQVQAMNDELKSRFSKLAGDQLTHDNPNIADLGDANRPTKLAEQFSELYDNEWTDAFSAIEERSSNTSHEEEIVHKLREILLNCFDQLTKISAKQISGIKSLLVSPWASLPVPGAIQMTTEQARTITQLRKQTTALAIDSIKKEIIKEYQQNTYYRELKPFIEKCSEICWLMVIQSPPVAMDYRYQPGDRFDKDVFKAYTQSGKMIEFVVWPPVYLHKGGPLLCKGIAQGKRWR